MKKDVNHISDYEISLIKALIDEGNLSQQNLLFKFNIFRFFNNKSTINQARIDEVKYPDKSNKTTGKKSIFGQKSKNIQMATPSELDDFYKIVNSGDLACKLNPYIKDHKLIIKARDTMISAVNCFNSPNIKTGTENYLILSCVAYTALFQSIAVNNNIDIVNKKNDQYCLSLEDLTKALNDKNIINKDIKNNLIYLIEVRDKIVHAPENFEFPPEFIKQLQANCFNFNNILIKFLGKERRLDNILSIALQFAQFQPVQINDLIGSDCNNNFEYVRNLTEEFEKKLSTNELESIEYKFNIIVTLVGVNNKNMPAVMLVTDKTAANTTQEASIAIKYKDRQELCKYRQKEAIQALKNFNIKVNQHILTKLNKKYKLKDNAKYCLHIPMGNGSLYKYSLEYIEYIKELLKKNPTE